MNLTASLLSLRVTYGRAHQKALAEERPDQAEILVLVERLVEELPPEALTFSCVQATLTALLRRLPVSHEVLAWRKRIGCHFYGLGTAAPSPLFELLFNVEVTEEQPVETGA